MLNEITLGKWEDWLPKVESQSVRLALLDMPYGTTADDWDVIPVLEDLWAELKRVLLPNGAAVCTANQPFTTILINSNFKWFKYCWVWDKVRPVGFQNARYKPMMQHEDICVFSKASHVYNPQMRKRSEVKRSKCYSISKSNSISSLDNQIREYTERYPASIIDFSNAVQTGKIHSTEKPLELFDYLIRTYSNPGDTVLDCFAGSGTTALAAVATGRNFICIEQDKEYWTKATKRLELARMQGRFNFDLEGVS